MFRTIFRLLLIIQVGAYRRDDDEEHPTTKFVRQYGYPAEEHRDIRTKDNYLLTLHRIPYGLVDKSDDDRPVILLMHGLLSSSVDWVNMGPGVSIVYDLADAGFDVWMGNARGTKWSQKHTRLDPILNHRRFWDFSWHQIGCYDLPAMIDYILLLTNQKQLYYIGHSQGTTAFFVLASMKPEYNEKIKLMIAFAPIAFMNHMMSPLLQMMSMFHTPGRWVMNLVGWYEFLPGEPLFNLIGKKFCSTMALVREMCASGFFMICGWDSQQLNKSTLPLIIENVPAGAASQQFMHYAQGIKSGKFALYDHGSVQNLVKYGSVVPPLYKLKRITTPVALVYAQNDWLSSVRDTKKLEKTLPNVVDMYMVPFKKFNHLDYVYAIDLKKLVNDHVLELLKKFTKNDDDEDDEGEDDEDEDSE